MMKIRKTSNKKRLLVIGASAYQHYLYETARRLGIWICSVDANPLSPMFSLSDDYRVIDFSDHAAVIKYGRSQNVNGVATINIDQGMKAVATIQKGLGVSSLGLDAITAATRKDLMRVAWQQAGVNQPRFWVFSENQKSSIIDLAQSFSKALIIKPVDNAAKRGISRLSGGFSEMLSLIDSAFSSSRVKKVIVEEFIEGTLIFAATYLGPSNYVNVILMRQHIGENLVQLRFDAPFSFGEEIDKSVIAEALKAAHCFGIGPYHTEIIVSPEGVPYLVETSPRVSYATVALSRLAGGFDPVLEVLKDTFQESLEADEVSRGGHVACLQHLQPVPGSIYRAGNVPAYPDGNLYEAIPLTPDGHVVKPFRTNEDRVFYFTVYTNSLDDLDQARVRIYEDLMTRYFSHTAV